MTHLNVSDDAHIYYIINVALRFVCSVLGYILMAWMVLPSKLDIARDDSAASSSLETLKMVGPSIGPLHGCFPNGSKWHVIAKPEHIEAARETWKGTGIVVTTKGEWYLGRAMGTSSLCSNNYVERKVEGWVKEVEKLSEFTVAQPHAAFAVFTHGLPSRFLKIKLPSSGQQLGIFLIFSDHLKWHN